MMTLKTIFYWLTSKKIKFYIFMLNKFLFFIIFSNEQPKQNNFYINKNQNGEENKKILFKFNALIIFIKEI